ncbi:MFS transporter [Mycobacterium stomatepiae]|uniref:MFS transporter n=1 Tax=Mycobacterium stomatepiae TaxID=470076 RepID=A0A7I7QC30_9MYCO|nr:MFS transporter [Mycobacterium stomatepiae]
MVLAILAAGAFMAQLDLFIVNIALPSIAHSFSGASLSSMSWIVTGYALVFATLLVPAGRLADHFGRRRVLLAGVAVFTAASLVCGSASVLWVAIAGRVLQGEGAAMMVPASLGLLWPLFEPREHNRVVGAWAGVAAVAASMGPTLGGLLVGLDWRWIFLINVPIGAVTFIAGLAVLPEVRIPGSSGAVDPVSVVTLLLAVSLLVLVTVEGPRWGWLSASALVCLAVAAAAALATVWRAHTNPRAIVEASLFKIRPFAASWMLINVLFLQSIWHYCPVRCGLAVSPGPITAAIFAPTSGRIADRIGRRATATIGCLAFAAGGVFCSVMVPAGHTYLASFVPAMVLAGIGSGLTQAPLYAAASALPDHRATTGSAMLNMSRQIGSAFGVAILVSLLSAVPVGIQGFRHGWEFIGTSCAMAAAVIFFGNVPERYVSNPESRIASASGSSTAGSCGGGR